MLPGALLNDDRDALRGRAATASRRTPRRIRVGSEFQDRAPLLLVGPGAALVLRMSGSRPRSRLKRWNPSTTGGAPRSLSRAAMGIFDRDRWQQLQPMLDHALDLSGDERVSWLVELRTSAPDIAEDLITLLS